MPQSTGSIPINLAQVGGASVLTAGLLDAGDLAYWTLGTLNPGQSLVISGGISDPSDFTSLEAFGGVPYSVPLGALAGWVVTAYVLATGFGGLTVTPTLTVDATINGGSLRSASLVVTPGSGRAALSVGSPTSTDGFTDLIDLTATVTLGATNSRGQAGRLDVDGIALTVYTASGLVLTRRKKLIRRAM